MTAARDRRPGYPGRDTGFLLAADHPRPVDRVIDYFGGAFPRPAPGSGPQRWAVVLAGGDGVRLRPLVSVVFGDDRPKQFAPLIGMRSLLRQTLDRVALLVEADRTVIVVRRDQEKYLPGAGLPPHARLLYQPRNRGTALGVLLPAHWIAWHDPDATVAVFPSDHFVLEEQAFMSHIGDVLAFVDRHPEWLVLVGARPTAADPGYGWVEPADRLTPVGSTPIYRAGRFREKPGRETAAALLVRGWLWNTFVIVARVRTLTEAARRILPGLAARVEAVRPFAGTHREERALAELYASAAGDDFSTSLLQAELPCLAVSELPALTWSDLGTPERLLATLRALRITPPWMHRLLGQVSAGRTRRHAG